MSRAADLTIVQAYGPGNARLETVGSLVSWPVNDTTFIDRQRYDLEVLAIDLAGNASVTEGGTLTFKNVFMNPDADMFKVVPDAAKEKQVAGVDVALIDDRHRHNADARRKGKG